MKKHILRYGLIAGLIVSLIMVSSMLLLSHGSQSLIDMGTSMLIGYASMLLAFSFVFIGIRNYRNQHNNGVISFGKAFGAGLLMVLIASSMYVISWMILYYFFIPDFFDNYCTQVLAELKASGASEAVVEVQAKEMKDMVKMLENPVMHTIMIYMEILPVGIVVTLISSLILRRKGVANE